MPAEKSATVNKSAGSGLLPAPPQEQLIPGTDVPLPAHAELKALARERGVSTRRLREEIIAQAQAEARQKPVADEGAASVKPAVVKSVSPQDGGIIDLKTRATLLTQQIGKISRPSRKWLENWVGLSAVLCIAVPVAVASTYYGLIAADQYVTESQFSVRSGDGNAAPDLVGMFTGFSSGGGNTTSDSFILQQYIHSRELLEDINRRVDLRAIFASSQADWFSRVGEDATIEHLLDYWRSMSDVKYDAPSSILTVSVRAFTPEESQRIGTAVLEASEKLINDLSRRAREDGLRYAREELSRAELRLKFARQQIRDFRDREQSLDPSKTAESRLGILSRLEGELASAEAEKSGISTFLNNDAPSVKVLNTRIAAIRRQIEEERAKLGGATATRQNGRVLSGVISEYEELAVEREFAEKAYVSSLAALERARMEIERQARYITTFVQPRLAVDALYPLRLQAIFVVLLVASILWCLGVLLVYAVRDHTM